MNYVSKQYLFEKWESLKWDMEMVILNDGPDDVAEQIANRKANIIDKLDAIRKEVSKA